MTRYYFHLHNDIEARDDEGVEFPDLAAARAYAVNNARFTAAETIKETGRLVPDHRIDVEDSDGNVLASVSFAEAVRIEGCSPPISQDLV